MYEDCGVDGPNSVGRRICSGKGLEHLFKRWVEGSGLNGVRALVRVHQVDDFLADGAEVLSHGCSSHGLFGTVEVSPPDAGNEDLEVTVGAFDPCESVIDVDAVAESAPNIPGRGLFLSGRFNHGVDAGFRCKAQISEESVAFLRGQMRQV